jgi:hypothetical protein
MYHSSASDSPDGRWAARNSAILNFIAAATYMLAWFPGVHPYIWILVTPTLD